MAKSFSKAPDMEIDPAKRYTAEMDTSMGTMTIALDAGFESHAAFLRAFRRRFGQTPGTFRKRDHRGARTVIRASALNRISLDRLYDRYGFPNEMLFAAADAGLTIESVPVRAIYEDEVSGINPFTSVPMILFLIARNYLRPILSVEASKAMLVTQESETNSTK